MKKILLGSAMLAVFASQAIAGNIYVAGKVGGSNGEANSIKVDEQYTLSPTFGSGIETSFTDNAVLWGGAVGYEYTSWRVPLRMEAEYLYRNHYHYNTPIEGGPSSVSELVSYIDNQTLTANFYVDVPVTRMFALFFGGGLGGAINTSTAKAAGSGFPGGTVRGTIDDYAFSWMTTAGLTVKPLKWLNLDLSYRYSDLGDISIRVGESAGAENSLITNSFAGQELMLGIRIDIPNMYKKARPKKAHPYMDK